MATVNLDIRNITKKYKSEQKLFSQWVMNTFAALDISCTREHPTHSESCVDPSIQELSCMTNDIAVSIQQTENFPEGIHDAINMVAALLAGRRECTALFRTLPLKDGQDRSREDASHQKAIEDFQGIYDTLQTAAAFAAPKRHSQHRLPNARRHRKTIGTQ